MSASIGINLDRPYLMRKATDVNMKLFMYFDQPGVYLNIHGKPVPETVAVKAGFDVKKWAKQKLKNDRMEKFREQVERELEAEDGDDEIETKTIYEVEGFKVIGRALGLADAYDADGEKLNDKPISVEEAKLLVDLMAGGDETPSPKGKTAKAAKTATVTE